MLDNVGPLRQWEGGSEGVPGTTERDLVLFEPAVAYRSGGGVVISSWQKERAEVAMLEILDASSAAGTHTQCTLPEPRELNE